MHPDFLKKNKKYQPEPIWQTNSEWFTENSNWGNMVRVHCSSKLGYKNIRLIRFPGNPLKKI